MQENAIFCNLSQMEKEKQRGRTMVIMPEKEKLILNRFHKERAGIVKSEKEKLQKEN